MKTLLFSAVIFLAQLAFAGTTSTVKVNGMVCSFCANSIEKKFKEKPEVSTVKVDLDSKIVTINYAPEKTLSDEQIKEIITKSGYTVVSITNAASDTAPAVEKAEDATKKKAKN